MTDVKIGFIGLGNMGMGMALNLLESEIDLGVYDLSHAARMQLAAAGATEASSAGELAGNVDLLFICLPFTPEVESVLFQTGRVLDGGREGLLIIDTSTLNYNSMLEIAQRVSAANMTYCDCPVSGLPQKAMDGTLTMMFGGPQWAFEKSRFLLDLMGETVIHCGEPGTGQMMKAVNNMMYNINIAGFCEIMPVAVKAGLDPEQLANVVMSGSSRSFASQHFVPRIMEGCFENDFPMGAAFKDIENAQDIVKMLGEETPLMDTMIRTYLEAMEMGLSDEPKSAMIKVQEGRLGQTVRKNRPKKKAIRP